MRKQWFFFTFLFIFIPMFTFADSYNSLWKLYEEAARKDLPQSQKSVLDKIIVKATAEKQYGHLLKAELTRMDVTVLVTPDSLETEIKKLEQKEINLRKSDHVLAAVYETVLGKIKMNVEDPDGENQRQAREYFKLAMTHPEQLAACKATDYRPFVETQIDSKWFDNDLLHVIGFETGDYKTMSAYYNTSKLRTAACLSSLYLIKNRQNADEKKLCKSLCVRQLDSLLTVYGDIPIAGEVATTRYEFMEEASDVSVEEKVNYINRALSKWGEWQGMNKLRNALKELTQPSFDMVMENSMILPDTKQTIVINQIRNIGELTMRITPIGVDGSREYDLYDDHEFAALKKKAMPMKSISQTKRYVGLPEYKLSKDSFEIAGLPEGIYLLEFSTDNKDIRTTRDLIYVSNLRVISEPLPGNRIRYAVVNAATGQPVKGASLRLKWDNSFTSNDEVKTQTIVMDDKGEYTYLFDKRAPESVWPSTKRDTYHPTVNNYNYFSFYKNKNDVIVGQLFTDRALYRPGQNVEVSFVLYSRTPDHKAQSIKGKQVKIELRDANYKLVGSEEITTDDYGSAACRFKLPEGELTGQFTLRAENYGSTAFRVEEYKRPTFAVELPEVNERYQVGDTVVVKGKAKTYSGVPVQGAKVAYTVTRNEVFWWWRYNRGHADDEELMSGEAVTDAEGSFEIEMPMILPDADEVEDDYYRKPHFYRINAEVRVTDVGGETREGHLSLPLGTKPTAFACSLPEKTERDSLKTIVFERKNAAGKNIDGIVKFEVDGNIQSFQAQANVPTNWPEALRNSLKSGKHKLKAICEQDTLEQEFILFDINDKKPCVKTHDWFYATADVFPRDGRPVCIQVGTSDPETHVFYSVIAEDKVLESGSLKLNNSIHTRKMSYKDSYGDGVLLTYAWVKDGVIYRHSVQIAKPMPDKRLMLTWKTFRDKLKPGQDEEWTLTVRKPDGRAVDAQLMAVLFDQSLNQIAPHDWHFNLSLNPSLPYGGWTGTDSNPLTIVEEARIKYLDPRNLVFSSFMSDLYFFNTFDQFVGTRANLMVMDSGPRRLTAPVIKKDEVLKEADRNLSETVVTRSKTAMTDTVIPSPDEEQKQQQSSQDQQQLRENLNETAFFFPALVTDGKGEVSLKFRLPESITTWQFMGIAHDRQINYGTLKSEAVAKKEVMIQPNMPRFLRQGDKATIAAKIFNTSEKKVSGTAVMELLDPETEKTVVRKAVRFNTEAGGTGQVTFDFTPETDTPLYICRITAEGKNFSDGEQHYLPVLPDKEMVTNTYSFTLHRPGWENIDISRLFAVKGENNKLTIEYTSNPAWLMIQALPTYAVADADNAIEQAVAYYVNALASKMLRKNPSIKATIAQWREEEGKETSLMSALEKNQELKQFLLNETPWVADADDEAAQKRNLYKFFDETTVEMRLSTALNKLNELQNSDGSWSWWKGMRGSIYMTTAVSEMMVRLNKMTGEVQQETTKMLNKAFRFMGKYLVEEHQEMKEAVRKGNKNVRPSETAVRILYLSAIDGRNLSADVEAAKAYMVNILSQRTKDMTIYGKANTALILAKEGKTAKAAEFLKSIEEYTVSTKEMGRYFDTPTAFFSWFDYRIPTQVAAIEAFKELKPEEKQVIDEMKRWLLQEKRTQRWATPINSVNAIYAFLDGDMDRLESTNDDVLKVDGKIIDRSKATAGLGYTKTTMPQNDAHTLSIEKSSPDTSWGAVYARFMQKASDIGESGTGMVITREILNAKKKYSVGDRVKIRLTVKADRDYDFVQIIDKRAACLEPVNQLSGYKNGYYITPKDFSTNYYIDKLAKGTHIIETEYVVDRVGTYETGTCVIQCAYAPEFSARAKAKVLEVE